MAILTWLGVPGKPEAWRSLGFDVDGPSLSIGGVLHELGRDPSWGFEELHSDTAPLGVPTLERAADAGDGAHANGIDRIDHVVYAVPDLDAAVESLTAVLGRDPKRRAFPRGPSGPEMAFFTVGGGAFIEVVASGRPPALWGIAYNTPDLDATVSSIRAAGGPVGDPKPSVQGGRIASVWKGHVGWGVAVMERPKMNQDE